MQARIIWRLMALVAVLVNVAFNYLYASDGTMTTVTDTYRTVFRPAGYAFSIWGVIYLSWIAFCVYQLLPRQRKDPGFDPLSILVMVSSLVSIAWLVSYTNQYIGASMLLIVGMLGIAIVQLRKAQDLVRGATVNKWLVLVPFSLYAAWLSVATIANAFIWVNAMDREGTARAEELWASALVVTAGMIGGIVAVRHRDPFFPLVVGWASLALWVEQGDSFTLFGQVCLVVAIIMALLSVYAFSRQWPEKKMVL